MISKFIFRVQLVRSGLHKLHSSTIPPTVNWSFASEPKIPRKREFFMSIIGKLGGFPRTLLFFNFDRIPLHLINNRKERSFGTKIPIHFLILRLISSDYIGMHHFGCITWFQGSLLARCFYKLLKVRLMYERKYERIM